MELIQTVGFLDIVFIVILVISIFLGLLRGVVREVLSLVGLAAAIYFAFKFSDWLEKNYISYFFEQSRVSYPLAFIIIIITTIFCVALINLFIGQLLRVSGLSFLNRILGMVFGALRGTVLCAILVIVIGFIPGFSQEKWWEDSTFAPFFKVIASHSVEYMPKNIGSYFGSTTKTTTNLGNEIINETQPANKEKSLRPIKKDKNMVENVLPSIDDGLKETKKTNFELGLTSGEDEEVNSSNKNDKKLVMESYQ